MTAGDCTETNQHVALSITGDVTPPINDVTVREKTVPEADCEVYVFVDSSLLAFLQRIT